MLGTVSLTMLYYTFKALVISQRLRLSLIHFSEIPSYNRQKYYQHARYHSFVGLHHRDLQLLIPLLCRVDDACLRACLLSHLEQSTGKTKRGNPVFVICKLLCFIFRGRVT